MIALIKKELTAKWHFALYGLLVMIPIYFYTSDGIDHFKAPREAYKHMATSEIALSEFLNKTPFQGTVLYLALGFFLGCSIMFEERQPKIWRFLIHRERKAVHVTLSKIISGSILFLIPSLIYMAGQLYWFNFNVFRIYSLPWTLLLPFFGNICFGWIMFLVGFTMFLPGIPIGFRGLALISPYAIMVMNMLVRIMVFPDTPASLFIIPGIVITILLCTMIYSHLVKKTDLKSSWVFLIYAVLVLATTFILSLHRVELSSKEETRFRWFTFTFQGEPVEILGKGKEKRAKSLMDGNTVLISKTKLCKTHSGLTPMGRTFNPKVGSRPFLLPLNRWPGSRLHLSYLPDHSLLLLTDEKGNREGYLGINGFSQARRQCTPVPPIDSFTYLSSSLLLKTQEGDYLWQNPREPPLFLGSFRPQAWGVVDNSILLFDGNRIARLEQGSQTFTYFETPPELENATFMRVWSYESGLGIFTINHHWNKGVPQSDTSVFATLLQENAKPKLNLFIKVGSNLHEVPTAMSLALIPFHDFISSLIPIRFVLFMSDSYSFFSDWRFWLTMLLKHFLFASLFTWYRFKREPSKSRLFSEFLGIIAFGFMFMVSIWLFHLIKGRITCPVCKAKSPLRGQTCPACHKAWPDPESRSIDLFDTNTAQRQMEMNACGPS